MREIYRLESSTDSKIIGTYPQIEKALYDCDPLENSLFIDNIGNRWIDFEPKKPVGILNHNAVITDLLSAPIMGFTKKLLISDKLKKIVQKYQSNDFQFFKCQIQNKDQEYLDYWILNPIHFKNENIDFKKSEFILMKGTVKKVNKLNISSSDDYLNELKRIKMLGGSYQLRILKLYFKSTEDNFFTINNLRGDIGYFVSEKFKKEIEYHIISGIDLVACI